jgi:hypothetical protein
LVGYEGIERDCSFFTASLAGAIAAAFVLRAAFRLTTHLSLPYQRIAAVSFLSNNEQVLRQLVESVKATEEIQGRIPLDHWVLVQAMDGKPKVVPRDDRRWYDSYKRQRPAPQREGASK